MRALDVNKHKVHLTNILLDIYKQNKLASLLGFKGGTAAMLFYNLPRFSVDLDFDCLHKFKPDSNEFKDFIESITKLLKKKYQVLDYSPKYNTLFWLVSYGKGLAKIKVEVSTRDNPYNQYITKSIYGVSIKVLKIQDMIAHKLIAVMERRSLANRDLFDIHYFLSSKYATEINYDIIKYRTEKEPRVYYKDLLNFLDKVNNKSILNGLGEVLTQSQKDWVKVKLLIELKGLVQRQIDLIK